ncbi:ankyrin repeat domain-containing protein [Haloferula sp. BvORR071]|uniref:ankyrin repeat domain-containing protein n=1 Tax=Haloferula sp. BvORR071 TaxID=1396141 RepID=UPI00054F7121|nr:ankyrin repeat domain-containing protein [Haloferula sp. BvORR071]
MTPYPIRRSGLLLLALMTPLAPLRAEDPGQSSPREILRDALYAEEVTRDASKAAENYAKVLELYKAQQPFAATALFRLAEVRRKQGNKEEAVKLYQELLREFPAAEVEGKLARENLAALGAGEVPAPAAVTVVVDEEAQELRRIQEMVKSSPDRAKSPQLAESAVENGQARVLEYLLESGLEEKPARLLPKAAQSGHVKIVQMLASRAKDAPEAGQALWLAIASGYKQVAIALLDAGVSPNYLTSAAALTVPPAWQFYSSGSKVSPLHLAIRRDLDWVRLLLDHGADPNAMAEMGSTDQGTPEPGKPIGTPLHEATRQGAADAVKLLLAKGADPNRAVPGTGITPLHEAAEADKPEILDALLQAGGKLEAKTAVVEPAAGESSPKGGKTPLMTAAGSASLGAVEFLLKKGADPNARSAAGTPVLSFAVRSGREKQLEVVRLLLDHKADPKVRFGTLKLARDAGHGDPFFTGTESETVTEYSLLYSAATTTYGDPLPTMSLLLEAGCSAGPELSYTIAMVATKDTEGKVVKALAALHHGPVNMEELPPMSEWKEAARTAYLEAIVYPTLAARPGASFVNMEGKLRPVELSPLKTNSDIPGPSGPAKLLLSNPSYLQSTPNYSSPIAGFTLTLVRKAADGAWSRTVLNPADDAPFPELLAGDIVELASQHRDWAPGEPRDSSQARQMYERLSWDLRKKVKFPVSIEIDGEARELTLRGDLLVYDPRRPNEVPWTGAAGMVGILKDFSRGDAEISVQRKGWPDVQVPEHPQGSKADFLLEAGDKVVVHWKPYRDQGIEARRKELRVQAEGFFAGSYYSKEDPFEERSAEGTLPTLIQALADLDGRWASNFGEAPRDNEIQPAWLQKKTPYPVVLLPYPDFSRIKIRRLEENGQERVIAVNLDPLVAAAAQGSLTVEQARGADQALQGGDIVEIPTRPDKLNEAWKGWSEAEATFFAKALDCRIQFTESDGVIALREIHYRAPRYLNWGGSWFPAAPVAGTPSFAVTPALLGNNSQIELTRSGKVSKPVDATKVYLRDGDAVKNLWQPLPRQQPNPANTPTAPAVRPARPRGGSR